MGFVSSNNGENQDQPEIVVQFIRFVKSLYIYLVFNFIIKDFMKFLVFHFIPMYIGIDKLYLQD